MDSQVYSGGQVPYMPEDKERLIRAGVALFECRVPYQYFFDKTVMGPYNCVAEEFGEPGRASKITLNWITGLNAGVVYNADPKGNCIGWIPDDPWYHNRLVLMGDPKLNPIMRHSPREGLVGLPILKLEFKAIRNLILCNVPIWKVMKNGVERGFFYTKKEAEMELEELNTVALKVDTRTGEMKAVDKNKIRYSIEEGAKQDFKPEIKELVRNYQVLQYGWTSSEAFTKEWRPKIAAEIKRLKAEAFPNTGQAGLTPEAMAASMGQWDDKQREDFRKLMVEAMKPKASAEKTAKTPPLPPLVKPGEKESVKEEEVR